MILTCEIRKLKFKKLPHLWHEWSLCSC